MVYSKQRIDNGLTRHRLTSSGHDKALLWTVIVILALWVTVWVAIGLRCLVSQQGSWYFPTFCWLMAIGSVAIFWYGVRYQSIRDITLIGSFLTVNYAFCDRVENRQLSDIASIKTRWRNGKHITTVKFVDGFRVKLSTIVDAADIYAFVEMLEGAFEQAKNTHASSAQDS